VVSIPNDGGPIADHILWLDRVGKRFQSTVVLDQVSLKVSKGETVAVIGPSGAGKTTLLRCINFLTPYDMGRIFVSGRLVGYRDEGGRLIRDSERNLNDVRKHIGMVFQKYHLFLHRTVLGNLIEGPVHVLGLSRGEATSRALAALELVGLTDKLDSYPEELSGGQQQRVGIARALCMQPDLMLFDEVTSALDPELVEEVLGAMRRLAQGGMTMLVVTHELGFARDVADRVVFMEAGRIIADTPAATFFTAPPLPRIEQFLRRSLAEPSSAHTQATFRGPR
jgi:polar amino acid transport system ATP-binding protein